MRSIKFSALPTRPGPVVQPGSTPPHAQTAPAADAAPQALGSAAPVAPDEHAPAVVPSGK